MIPNYQLSSSPILIVNKIKHLNLFSYSNHIYKYVYKINIHLKWGQNIWGLLNLIKLLISLQIETRAFHSFIIHLGNYSLSHLSTYPQVSISASNIKMCHRVSVFTAYLWHGVFCIFYFIFCRGCYWNTKEEKE